MTASVSAILDDPKADVGYFFGCSGAALVSASELRALIAPSPLPQHPALADSFALSFDPQQPPLPQLSHIAHFHYSVPSACVGLLRPVNHVIRLACYRWDGFVIPWKHFAEEFA